MSSAFFSRSTLTSFWVIAFALTAARLLVLIFSDANLGPDEAQYWFWSEDLDYGYFSKPPLIAWAIAITTGVFGEAEWAVRLSAPLFHFGAAAFLYRTAKELFDKTIAFWTGVAWLTLPGAILSSFLMTTDAPLMFFWSGALYAIMRIAKRNTSSAADFIFLGAMIGFGFLAKYAMIYFPLALFLSAAFFSSLRTRLLRRELFLTGFIAMALITPNILWNIDHDFQTLTHTAENANWAGSLFHPIALLSFLGGQFAVAGVIPFAILLWLSAHIRWRHFKADRITGMLIIFALTPLIIVSIQSFISRAHANWAAAAYPAAIMLITAWLFQRERGWVAKASVAFHFGLFAVFSAAAIHLPLLDAIGLSATAKEIRGWSQQSADIANIAEKSSHYDAILVDDRSLTGALLYYQRERDVEVVALDPNARISTHYEAFIPFDPARHRRVLFVTTRNDDAHVNYRFKNITPIGASSVDLGGKLTRTYHLFDISGYYGPGTHAGN